MSNRPLRARARKPACGIHRTSIQSQVSALKTTTTKVHRQAAKTSARLTGATRRQRAVVASRYADKNKNKHQATVIPIVPASENQPVAANGICRHGVCTLGERRRRWSTRLVHVVALSMRIRLMLLALLAALPVTLSLCTLDFTNPNMALWQGTRWVHDWLGAVTPPLPSTVSVAQTVPARDVSAPRSRP